MAGKPYYITTPIYYVNGEPHLGHVYTTVACDVLARFKRLDGNDVFFLTGTDEHGLKVHQAAKARGIDPQKFTDEVSKIFKDVLPPFNISNDDFIRTTEDRHKRASQALWTKLVESGDIYLDKYSGWYAVRDEAYYGEEELITTPDGKKIAPSGAECNWVEEESYFFRLSAWQDRLLKYYDENPDFIQPDTRRNEVISFVKGGLKDLSISRTTFDWGIPVPGNPKHVMYVWIDALTNYLTAIGYPDEDSQTFKKFWPADLHMVGKEIIRFHCVYWPAFLIGADLPPPKKVFAHGWWTAEGEKMSKSLGNVILPGDLIERYGVDASRYFLLREVPFGNDGDFSHAQAVQRINNDLANGLGNLAQRTLSMIAKNCGEAIPAPGPLTAEDKTLLEMAQVKMLAAARIELDRQRFHKALDEIWSVVTAANGYIDAQAPWTLKKTDSARMETVLYVLAEVIRCLGLIVQPFMPDSATKMLDQLAVPADQRGFEFLNAGHMLKPNTKLPSPQGVFPRIVEEELKAVVG
jgi:methionyl-tRNA synthetase